MKTDRLTNRELNRATLARQLLLAREPRLPFGVVEHLVGMQAQIPLNPYLGLWSRLDRFAPDEVGQLLLDRKLVRIVVMRGTIHLVSADDCLVLRPLAQPVLDNELKRHSEHARFLVDVDLKPVLRFARSLLAEQPMTGAQLRAAFAAEFPDLNAAALAYACRNHLAFIQVPPRGIWGRSGAVTSTTAEAWLGRSVDKKPSLDAVILRYLAAFGPASAADMAAWSRLTGFKDVIERLRPQLRSFRGDNDRELLDLPDAPRPPADVPAPPRFLPEYDNVLLSHADRSRFMSEEHRGRLFFTARVVRGTVLYDGFVRGTWRVDRTKGSADATLFVDHVDRLPKKAMAAIGAEGRRMVKFLEAGVSSVDVRFVELT